MARYFPMSRAGSRQSINESSLAKLLQYIVGYDAGIFQLFAGLSAMPAYAAAVLR
jgi:hypothetical protein